MIRNEVEKLVNAYLVELEEFDNLQMGEDIIKSFQQAFTGKELKEAPSTRLVEKFVERKAYLALENDFIDWSKKRLENWYIIKYNALKQAVALPIAKESAAEMAKEAITIIRQGGNDNPNIVADIYFLQDLAKESIPLNFNLPWETYEQEENRKFTKKEKIFVEAVLNRSFKQAMPERRAKKREGGGE